MKKAVTLIAIQLLMVTILFGGHVDLTTARTVAGNFYFARKEVTEGVPKTLSSQKTTFRLVQIEKTIQPDVLYYIFDSYPDKGFVIVSGDDRVRPVLGYSFAGHYHLTDQPPAFQEWLNHYKEQIQYVLENDLGYTSVAREEWSAYSDLENGIPGDVAGDAGPLLSTTWKQGCYYNQYCPEDERGPCGKAYGGCVAVAIAQIMNYWEHPVACNYIPEYDDKINYDSDGNEIINSDYGLIHAINSSTYAWADMPDHLLSYSSEVHKQAISKLIYHCGVASEMNYGPNSSSAYSSKARMALVNSFQYSSSARFVSRSDYSNDADWKNMLMTELDYNRPIYYRGGNTSSHAFVCDGYQDDYFHFNWGWGGYCDGYFTIDNLTPSGRNYNDYQYVIKGIYPYIRIKIAGHVLLYEDEDTFRGFEGIPMCGTPIPIYTNSEGYYEFFVEKGWSGKVVPLRPGYVFSPASIAYTNVTSDVTDGNYFAEAAYLYLDLGVGAWVFPCDAVDSARTFSVSSNTEWTVSTDADWITLDKTSGSNDDSVTLRSIPSMLQQLKGRQSYSEREGLR